MRVLGLDVRSPVLGRVRTRLPVGLVAVVGPTEASREAFLRLFRRGLMGLSGDGVAEQARVVTRERSVGTATVSEELVDLRLGTSGGPGRSPDDTLSAAAVALGRLRGGSRVEEALAGAGRAHNDRPEGGGGGGGVAGPSGHGEVGETREELARAERELRRLRADHAELAGEVEVATMEWLRERQDAETHLQAYRDRARELKARLTHLEEAGSEAPCPTCRRVLGSHYAEVVAELREEWESVVQDGSWWKRRREQLDLKPEALRELEGRSLRLQAATERSAEHVEQMRSRRRGRGRAEHRVEGPPAEPERGGGADAEDTDVAGRLIEALKVLRCQLTEEARDRVLEHAGRWLLRMSGGRLIGMTLDAGRDLAFQAAEGPLEDPTSAERAAATIAIRIGAMLTLLETEGDAPEVMLLGTPFDDLDEETRLRTIELLGRLRPKIPQVLLLTGGDTVELCPEAFDAVLDLEAFRRNGGKAGRPAVAGVGRVRIG